MILRFRPRPATLGPFSPTYNIATWFQSGRIRPASGSWGTLAALPFCWWIHAQIGLGAIAVFAAVLWLAGTWAIKSYAAHTTNPDPSEVVIDEAIGLALGFLCLPMTVPVWAPILLFVAFRVLDSLKPGPVGWCDRNIKGVQGVIIDDVVAGLIAGMLVRLLLSF